LKQVYTTMHGQKNIKLWRELRHEDTQN